MTKVSDDIKEQLSLEQVVEHIRWNEGLVPAIVQDVDTREVLMMAYMNRESLKLSLESGKPGSGHARVRNFGIKEQLQAMYRRSFL